MDRECLDLFFVALAMTISQVDERLAPDRTVAKAFRDRLHDNVARLIEFGELPSGQIQYGLDVLDELFDSLFLLDSQSFEQVLADIVENMRRDSESS